MYSHGIPVFFEEGEIGCITIRLTSDTHAHKRTHTVHAQIKFQEVTDTVAAATVAAMHIKPYVKSIKFKLWIFVQAKFKLA